MMNKKPKLVLVGRPNVGKSALFNRICKQRKAIVDEAEGITRDRIYAESELFGLPFTVIDTGGINPGSKEDFNEVIRRQAEIAIEEADTLVMVVDCRIGVTALDLEVAKILKRTDKPLSLAVNKADAEMHEDALYPFYQLGIQPIIPVSAEHGRNIAELLEEALKGFETAQGKDKELPGVKVAIVGKPNVGKSSLVNFILEDERCAVSPIAGTTRDSIDAAFSCNGTDYTLVDTAGIRRKGAEHEVVDKFAAIRTQRAIERSDLCLLMIDAQEGITHQEKKIAKMIEEAGKGCILLLNKWDLVKSTRMEHSLRNLREQVPFLEHCPKLFISAKTGRNVEKIFALVDEVNAHLNTRITTHQLNKFVGLAIQKNHPPMIQGKRLRVYYMAQVSTKPCRFVLFVNYPNLMTGFYKKYLYNQFRLEYKFIGVPIEIHLRGKKNERSEAKRDNRTIYDPHHG